MGVAIKRLVWLECIGVVSWCCFKEVHVYRFPHITYPYNTCITSFFCSNIPTFLFTFLLFINNLILVIRRVPNHLSWAASFDLLNSRHAARSCFARPLR